MGLLEDITCLTTAIETGSFAAAARRLGVTPSAVSRRVSALEEDLGARLLARTTRTLRLTDDGRAFHARCARILEELAEARGALARARERPSGVLRVESATAISRVLLAPRLPAFLAKYPELRLELTARDAFVDLVAEGADVALRIGSLRPANLIAKKLGEAELWYVASPAYLRRRGRPRRVEHLHEHDLLGFLRDGRPDPWRFPGAEGSVEIPAEGCFHSNDFDAMLALVAAGRGIAAGFDFLVADDVRAGRLVRVLDDAVVVRWPLHALYTPNRHLLPKVRVFLDFVAAAVDRGATGGAGAGRQTRPG